MPNEMSRDELLAFVRKLPEKTPIASTLNLGHSSKQSWINWLSNYADFGDHPQRAQRGASFIYNRVGGTRPYLFGSPKQAGSIKSEYKEPPKLLPLHQEIPRPKRPQFGEYCHGTWLPSIFEKKGEFNFADRPIYKTISCTILNKFGMTNE